MANAEMRPSCPACGARLRHGRSAGERCDPCQRIRPQILLPDSFYDQRVLVSALAELDFGPVFLRVRAELDWNQTTLGEHLGLEQGRVSDIELGKRSVRDARVVVRIANALAIPASRLGFGHGVTVGEQATSAPEGGWMERRNFVAHVSALALASAAAGPTLDVDRLLALLDTDSEEVRTVGEADVTALERATGEYERLTYTKGGGYARETAVAHFRATVPLLAAQVDPALQDRLHAAAVHLALQTGWMCFDDERHELARRLWIAGLQIARACEGPISTDLTGHLLFVMAQQALQLQRPDEALRLVQVGQASAQGRYPVSPSTATTLCVNLAFAQAALGDSRRCERALGHAQEEFLDIDLADAAPWACVDGAVKVTTWCGHARYELARATGDLTMVSTALPALIESTNNPRAMSRALYMPDLAGAHALTGDIDTAVIVGHQAVEAITCMHSRRAYRRLQVLHKVLEPMAASPDVRELRERLVSVAV